MSTKVSSLCKRFADTLTYGSRHTFCLEAAERRTELASLELVWARAEANH